MERFDPEFYEMHKPINDACIALKAFADILSDALELDNMLPQETGYGCSLIIRRFVDDIEKNSEVIRSKYIKNFEKLQNINNITEK